MKRTICLIIIITIIFILLLTGCAKAPTGHVVSQESVKIGAVLSLTGVAAQYGESARQGIELAVNEINSKGGVNGKKLVVVYEDDGTDPVKAVTAFNKLVSVDEVSAIVGGTWDFNYNSIAPLAESSKIVLFTWENVKTEGLVMNNYTFVMRPELRKIVSALKEEVEDRNIRRFATVRYISTFAEDLVNGVKDIMKATGGEFVLDETYTEIGGNDFRTTVLKLKDAKVDAVLVDMLDTDLVNFIKRAREQKLDLVIFSHSIIDDALVNPELDHSLFNGIIYFDWDTPPSDEFRNMFRVAYGKDPARSADGAYDSVIIITEALSKVNDKTKINTYIENNVFRTINGELGFKEHVLSARIVFIKQVINGKANVIGKREIRT